jgi:paraquat-inducible protein A
MNHHGLIACEYCDSIHRRVALAPGDGVRCRRCFAVMYRASRWSQETWFALTVAAAILYAIANACPVVVISFGGLHDQATLWQSALALAHGAAAPIAVPAALFIVIVPGLQIALLVWVLAFARARRAAPALIPLLRLWVALRSWSMMEVCMLGILVSAIKLSSFLQVAAGPGLWAAAGLTVLMTLIAGYDTRPLWLLTPSTPVDGTAIRS